MPELLIGLVTEVSSRDSGGKTYHDVFVSVGRRTVRTTGGDGGYEAGQSVILRGYSALGMFDKSEITFVRQERLTQAAVCGLIGVTPQPAAKAS